MEKKQVKYGAILSYILIFFNATYGLVLTPFIISHLGNSSYGVYKTITSLTASLTIIDLGVGGTIQRYTAKYLSEDEESKIPNFVAMGMIIAGLLSLGLLLISAWLFFSIEPTYGNTFNDEQIKLAKIIFVISIFTIVAHIFENVFHGLVTGYNKFIFGNGIKVILLFIKIIAIVVFLLFSSNAVGLVLVTLMINLLFVFIELLYSRYKLNVKIHFSHWERGTFFEAGKYTLLMFLTSLAGQICTNLDNIVIGAIRGPDLVTVYSVGLLIFSMFSQLSCGISGVMLPTVTNVLSQDDGDEKIINVIIKAGRAQFILLGAAIVGFIIIGNDFIHVWMGDGFEKVYIITLILIVPAIFELCVNVCLSILQAKNMLGFRTLVLSISAVINGIITIILVKYWSFIGAAVGTAFSYVLCSLICMNIYYSKKLKLPMIYIYKQIVSKVWLCIIIAGICVYFSSRFLYGNWLSIIANVCIFGVVYYFSLITFGLDKDERKIISFIKLRKGKE